MYDKIKQWKERPLSWSQISSFEYDPKQWFDKYILGIEQPKTPELEFGSMVGKKLETDPTFLPQIQRHNVMEHEFKCEFGGVKLVGYADSFCTITNRKLAEYKSGVKIWDKSRVDQHGQLTFYALCIYIMYGIKPEDIEIELIWMPTKRIEKGDLSVTIEFVEPIEENIKVFKTKRTMSDILKFGARIKKDLKEMELYALSHYGTCTIN